MRVQSSLLFALFARQLVRGSQVKVLNQTCTMPKNTTVKEGDDTPGILNAAAHCGEHSRLLFAAGTTYNLFTPLELSSIHNVEFVFEGNLTLSENVTEVQNIVRNTKTFPGHWIQIKGRNITLTGSKDPRGGWFIGHGDRWWVNSNQVNRPRFFGLSARNMTIRDMKVLNPVAWVFSISGNEIAMTNTLIDARSRVGFPFNTDGISVSGSNVLIDGFKFYNGDDGIVVAPPAVNLTARNIEAHGTHGLSVSCRGGTGGNYTFENAVIYDSLIGCRFKGKIRETCNVTDVLWRNITVHNVSYPIHFIEDYFDPEAGKKPSSNGLAAHAERFRYENISGDVAAMIGDGSCVTDPCWYFTSNQSSSKGLYLLCKDAEHCKDFHFSNINLKTANGRPAGEVCTGLDGVVGMGITCTNGTVAKE